MQECGLPVDLSTAGAAERGSERRTQLAARRLRRGRGPDRMGCRGEDESSLSLSHALSANARNVIGGDFPP